MNILKRLRAKYTKKDFKFAKDDIMYVVASPDDFFEQAAKLKYDVFSMACLQEYMQLDSGKWIKGSVVPFEYHSDMIDAGIIEL